MTLAATLAACGGGSGTPPASVNGTAATGASIAAGTVTLKCVSGTSTAATTGTDGSFTIDVSSVTLPCVGRVDYKDSSGVAQKLHTFIGAVGTANITPVTDLLVANLTGGTPADAFDKFDATKAKTYTTALVKAAAAAVKTYLKNTLGVDTTNLPDDPVGTKLTAKSGSVAGDAFDKVLDDIQAKLKAGGKKLSDIAADVAKSAGGAGVGGSALGAVTVSAASNTLRNGTFSPAGAKFTNTVSGDFGFNGQTTDGKFEIEIVASSGGTIKRAHLWFFDSGGPKFFGCGGTVVPCSSKVGYEPLLKQFLLSGVNWAEVNASLDGSGNDTLVGAGETLTVTGTLDVSK